jgi:hypothetical protein
MSCQSIEFAECFFLKAIRKNDTDQQISMIGMICYLFLLEETGSQAFEQPA